MRFSNAIVANCCQNRCLLLNWWCFPHKCILRLISIGTERLLWSLERQKYLCKCWKWCCKYYKWPQLKLMLMLLPTLVLILMPVMLPVMDNSLTTTTPNGTPCTFLSFETISDAHSRLPKSELSKDQQHIICKTRFLPLRPWGSPRTLGLKSVFFLNTPFEVQIQILNPLSLSWHFSFWIFSGGGICHSGQGPLSGWRSWVQFARWNTARSATASSASFITRPWLPL